MFRRLVTLQVIGEAVGLNLGLKPQKRFRALANGAIKYPDSVPEKSTSVAVETAPLQRRPIPVVSYSHALAPVSRRSPQGSPIRLPPSQLCPIPRLVVALNGCAALGIAMRVRTRHAAGTSVGFAIMLRGRRRAGGLCCET